MARRHLLSLLGLTLTLAPATASAKDKATPTSGPDPVVTWNANAGAAATAACLAPVGNPLHESRMYAMPILRSTTPSMPSTVGSSRMPTLTPRPGERRPTPPLRLPLVA